MFLTIFAWVAVGLLVGWIATLFVDLRGDQPLIGMLAGVAGSVAGGLAHIGLTEAVFNVWSTFGLVWSAAGAAVASLIYHMIRSRSISKEAVSDHRNARGVGGRAL